MKVWGAWGRARTSEGDDFLLRMHDSGFGGNGATEDVVFVVEVHDDDLLRVLVLADADEAV